MSFAITLLTHAIRMIFSDIGGTLRTLSPGLAVIIAASLALYALSPAMLETILTNTPAHGSLNAGSILSIAVAAIALIVGIVITIVIWHRFVLLSDADRAHGLMPSAGMVASYVGTTILLGLIAVLIAIPLFIIVGIVATAAGGSVLVITVISTAVTAILGWAVMRYSLTLPAVALGTKMSFTDSWRATAPLSQTIFWLTVAVSILNFVLSFLVGLTAAGPLLLNAILQLVVSVITMLISASVLTTLYGHLVEGRPIG